VRVRRRAGLRREMLASKRCVGASGHMSCCLASKSFCHQLLPHTMMQTRRPSRKAMRPKIAQTRPMTCSPASTGAFWKNMARTRIWAGTAGGTEQWGEACANGGI
jgi:hypothetical protein